MYLLPGVTDYGVDTFVEQAETIRENGGDGVAFFSWSSYRGTYADASDRLFGNETSAPTWDAKAAVSARLGLLRWRLEDQMEDLSIPSFREAASNLSEALKTRSLADASGECKALFDAFDSLKGSVPESASATLEKDVSAIKTICSLERDGAKQAYLETHPLPENLRPEDRQPAESESGDADPSGDESQPEKTPVELNWFEKVMQVLALIILIGGILLLPLYYVLYRRRKKIIQSFDEQTPDGEEKKEDDPENERKR